MPESDQRFGPRNRIRKRTEFQWIYQKGEKVMTPFFFVYFLQGTTTCHRLGITVTRKIGNAVTRNRAKRMIREVFRRNRPTFLPHDWVVNARPAIREATYAAIVEAWRRVLETTAPRNQSTDHPAPAPARDDADGNR